MNAPQQEFGAMLSADGKRRQRARSLAIAWSLAALALIVFLVTVVKMGGHRLI